LDDVVVTAGFVGCADGDCLPALFASDDSAGGTVGVLGAVGPTGGVPTSTIKIPRFNA